MKLLFTIITASVLFVFTAIAQPTNGASDTQYPTHTWKINPDVFLSNLKLKITPKDGETSAQLLRRHFHEHHIDLDEKKTGVFISQSRGKLFIKASQEQIDKIEPLIFPIAVVSQ